MLEHFNTCLHKAGRKQLRVEKYPELVQFSEKLWKRDAVELLRTVETRGAITAHARSLNI